MSILIIICLICIVYWKCKNLYAQRIRLKYKYRLYDLRNQLREYAIQGKIDRKSWVFNYLDTSISKTVHELQFINLFTVILLHRKYGRKQDFLENKHKVMKGIGENNYTSALYDEYGHLLIRYTLEKQFIPMLLFNLYYKLHITIYQRVVKKVSSKLKGFIGNVRFFPETSTTYEIA